MNRQSLIPGTIVVIWFIGCAVILWWFEYLYSSGNGKKLILFNIQGVQELYPILKQPLSSKPLVVHFKDDECPCERSRIAHVREMQPMLREIDQVTLSRIDHRLNNLDVIISPAVAIWDQFGELAYYGPYSSGMSCGQGFSFIGTVLERVLKNDNPQWLNNQGFGCFCNS